MALDSLSTKDAAAHEHAKVARSSKQRHGTKEKDHSHRNSRFWRNCSSCQSYAMGHEDNSERQGKQKRSPIENTRFPFSPPGGQPRGCHQITREQTADTFAEITRP